MRDDLSRVPGEMHEQFEFFWSQVQGLAQHLDAVCRCIDNEIAGRDRGCSSLRRAAKMGANTGQQFLDVEGLCNVVVGTAVERLDFRSFMVANREDEHRR